MILIDLSVTISEKIKEPFPTTINYEDHKEGAKKMGGMLFGGVESSVFPDGNGPAGEFLTVNSHTGTHVDAPYHYFPTCGGKPSRTIDEMPLDWFFRDGVVLDFTDKPDGYMIEPKDLIKKLEDINYTLKPYDIVLIRCDADKRLHDPDYVKIHVGASAKATHWLIDQGIKVMGTDGWGWDIPLHLQAADFKANPREGVIWQAHYVGIEKEYCQIEKLANLDKLPPFGFKVACFPAKIEKASAGWTRAVAILDN
ncbi:cyclase family protein [Winogradskyella echinorum]|uniref:Cyclase family protein n=1 Tax=Winogradskyella echinorum TaxID=538189 RepID=A0ABR6Y0P4_9FLAO|nr:cyclase family protein [Winogradskyella echinorum]MBC3846309.1 cyclase family protein [Winogradskyella echinorum]MBC5750657.1 cyclase family protein [Winogradskyella echinorum]